MIYSTTEFIVLMMVLVPMYGAAPPAARRALLLVSSILFIFWAGWITTAMLVAVSFVMWATIRLAAAFGRKLLLIQLGIALLALNLLFWKYSAWFLRELGVSPDTPLLQFLAETGLPIGISFYTITGIAWLVDYYRGETKPRGFFDFLLFESFFGHLIAGPIVRHNELFPQLDRVPVPSNQQILSGLELFAVGFFKKLVLGDLSAQYADPIFADMGGSGNADIFLAIALYTVQIYGDFSGYTDMGRGASRMLGIELPENFNAPYLSTSIRDFWRRWHMTFGRWLRDYIYIPLGGNRRGFWRTLRNIMLTMTLCGFWHGAAWNFLVWGIYHGVLMAGDHAREKILGWRLPDSVMLPFTLLLVMAGWAIFRVEQLSDLRIVARSVSGVFSYGFKLETPELPMAALLLFSCAIGVQIAQANIERLRARYSRLPAYGRGVAMGLVLVTAMLFRGQEAPFIYFEF